MTRRISLMFGAAVLSVSSAMAQTSFATLMHEGAYKTFNGSSALSKAIESAEDGDVITLSEGTFEAPDPFNKAVTIRGAGIVNDELSRKTIIGGELRVAIPEAKSKSLSLEGLFINGPLSATEAVGDLKINKCVIVDDFYQFGINTTINHSFLWYIRGGADGSFTVTNSFVNVTEDYGSSNRYDHCIIQNVAGSTSVFTNCILDCDWTYWGALSGYADHCVYMLREGQKAPDALHYNDITFVSSRDKLFTNWTDYEDVTPGEQPYLSFDWNQTNFFNLDLHLNDSFNGSSPLQVGIYGGANPYSPYLDQPTITKLLVAPKSTADGKLSVDVEVRGVK